MAKPLFVLGKQRSGTTWLANQLCRHPDIAAPTHELHGGNHASLYFSHIDGRFGPLDKKSSYVEFVETMAVSDTMRMLGVDRKFLYSLWPTTYQGVFTTVMNRYAEQKGAVYWLDKSNEQTVLITKLARLYPDAKFIAIIRNIYDNISSTVGRYDMTNDRQVRLIRAAADWVRHKKAIEHFSGQSESMLVITYESFKDEHEQALEKICTFLGLDYDPIMAQQAYKPNTTFVQGRIRNAVLTTRDCRLIDIVVKTSEFTPLALLDLLAGDKLAKPHRKNLPPWYFSLHQDADRIR